MWFLKKVLFVFAFIALCISFIIINDHVASNKIKKNFIPVEAEITFSITSKRRIGGYATRVNIKYTYNGEQKTAREIIAPLGNYKTGYKITIYIDPKDENNIKIPNRF